MKTLTLITGLPYSGKTTKAKDLIDKDHDISVRISQKDYKQMIYDRVQGAFSQFYTDNKKSITTKQLQNNLKSNSNIYPSKPQWKNA